jgi:hypothetical protein
MLLVKDFKVQLTETEGHYQAHAWNAHAQFTCESKSHYYVVQKAVLECLKYHVARYFEAAYIISIGTGLIVYRNLAFTEFEKKLDGCHWAGNNKNALVTFEGKPAHLDLEVELCHGFRIVRVVAVRFLTTVLE